MKQKFLLFLVLSVCSLILNSCNRDEDNTNFSLIGSWSPYKGELISSKDKKTIISKFTYDDCEKKSTRVFTDSKLTSVAYIDINGNCNRYTYETSYTFDSKGMKITADGKTVDVLLLTNSEMNVFYLYGDDLDQDGKADYLLIYYKKN